MSKHLVSPDRLSPVALGCLLATLSGSRSTAAEASGAIDLFTLCLASLPEAGPNGIWAAWSLAPAVVVPLVLATLLYVRGLAAQQASAEIRRSSLSQSALFIAGIGCLVVALTSPLCRMASTLAWAHMVQHVLLVAGAPCSSP